MSIFPKITKTGHRNIAQGDIALMPLEPLGQGTGEVESLTSYLIRLACDHWNTPTHLYTEILARYAEGKASKVKSDSRLDSFTSTAASFVNALNACSPLDFDFRELTCMAWAQVFSSRVAGPLNRELRWCVDCYRQMRDEAVPLHQRLSWSLEPVTVCPRHMTHLHSDCPHCGAKQRFLVADCVAGHCQRCGRELYSSAAEAEHETDHNSEALWKSRACEDLIRTTRGEAALGKGDLREAVQRLVVSEFEGSVRLMCKELQVNPDAYRSFLHRDQRTNLALLIDFAYRIDVTPSELFSRNSVLRINRRRIRPSRRFRTYKALTDERRKEIHQQLRQIIDSADELSSTTEVAAMVGINRNLLIKRFPKENSEIVSKVKARLARQKRERDEERAQRVRSRAQELIDQNIYPSDRQVRKDQRVLASDLRLPQIKIVLREIQEEFLAAKPPQHDDEALTNRINGSSRKTPTSSEISQSMRTYCYDVTL